jgi:AcrR family transcriptional regulator
LYHRFDSKDALATAIIEQGTNLTRDAFRHVCESEVRHEKWTGVMRLMWPR